MTVRLNTNQASMNAQRRLGEVSSSLGKTYERLSSGLRVNRASDDAAGLAVSSVLNVNARVYSQGLRNVNDALSMSSIGSGATRELSNVVVRLQELAEQSANGTLGAAQRLALDREAQALRNEFNRIVSVTEFNGRNVLMVSDEQLDVQAGGSSVSLKLSELFTYNAGDGTFKSPVSYGGINYPSSPDYTAGNQWIDSADFNGDGLNDIVTVNNGTTAYIRLSNGDGTFRNGTNAISTDLRAVFAGDVNNDGKQDFVATAGGLNKFSVFLGNGDGSFKADLTFNGLPLTRGLVLSDLNSDGNLDVVAQDGDNIQVSMGNGNGTFSNYRVYDGGNVTQEVIAADLDSDGKMDLIASSSNDQTVSVFWGNGDGSFLQRVGFSSATRSAISYGDYNNDGRLDFASTYSDVPSTKVFLNQGGRSFSSISFNGNYLAGDMFSNDQNGDGNLDLIGVGQNGVFVALGNGNGTFKAYQSFSAGNYLTSLSLVDLNDDGVLDVVSVATNDDALNVLLANSNRSSFLPTLSLATVSNSKQALTMLKRVSTNIGQSIGVSGASSMRLETISSLLQTNRENYLAAASQILDADVATDTAELTRKQILQSSAQAVLSQANQLPQLALRLLQSG